jgi:hypothetical protein
MRFFTPTVAGNATAKNDVAFVEQQVLTAQEIELCVPRRNGAKRAVSSIAINRPDQALTRTPHAYAPLLILTTATAAFLTRPNRLVRNPDCLD